MTEFISPNEGSIVDKTVIRASVKGCICNVAIQFSSKLLKHRQQKILDLEKDCKLIKKDLKKDYTLAKGLKSKQAALNDLSRNRVEFLMLETRHKYYSEGIIKQQEAKRAIRCPQPVILPSTKDINRTFKEYFELVLISFVACCMFSALHKIPPACGLFLDAE